MAKENLVEYDLVGQPIGGARENVYYHSPNADAEGVTYAAVVNDELEIGVYVKFNKNQLPKLIQWKQLSEAEYVIGIEPANCLPVGRAEQKKRGGLEYIKPGEKRKFELEIGVLTDNRQIEEFRKIVESLG